MITPRFSCDQTDDAVIVSLYCPSIRAPDVEINVDDTLLTVHINPYFLRLNFPHAVVEDDNSSAIYDPSTGFLKITLTKEVKGKHFADLDLLAKLLAPRSTQPPPTPSIEVLESFSEEEDVGELSRRTTRLTLEENDEFLEAAKNDWQVPQMVPNISTEFHSSSKRYYGFLDRYTGYFMHVAHTENEVNELGPNAEEYDVNTRRDLRIAHENEKWDEEHYMADYVDDEYIQELIAWKDPTSSSEVSYTEQEDLEMLRLPRREYIISVVQERSLYLTLISLLFAYAYDKRTTLHDPTPESAWTICSLVPAFSALDPPPYQHVPDVKGSTELRFSDTDLMSTLVASYRRSLAFPLYRSFQLAEVCRNDVANDMAQGKRLLTRSLLEMKRILDHHEVYYVYSKIWMEDFCVWIQADASDATLRELAQRVRTLTVSKNDIGWDVEQLEEATRGADDGTSDSDDESTD